MRGMFGQESGVPWMKHSCWAADWTLIQHRDGPWRLSGASLGERWVRCLSNGLERTLRRRGGCGDRNADNSFKAFCCEGCRETGW